MCSRNLGFTSIPIVCVNVDGFYDPFVSMLDRAHAEGIMRIPPGEVLHFEPTAELVVRWAEGEAERTRNRSAAARKAEAKSEGGMGSTPKGGRGAYRRVDSFLSATPFGWWSSAGGDRKSEDSGRDEASGAALLAMAFIAGLLAGGTVISMAAVKTRP